MHAVVDARLSLIYLVGLCREQLEFLSDTGRTDDASKLAGGTEEPLEISAELLGLSTEELTGALLTRPLQVAREKFVKPNKVGEAQSARDALAKDVYLGIFNYLLKKINEATRWEELNVVSARRPLAAIAGVTDSAWRVMCGDGVVKSRLPLVAGRGGCNFCTLWGVAGGPLLSFCQTCACRGPVYPCCCQISACSLLPFTRRSVLCFTLG